MTWRSYADYLDSPVWARKRAAAMRRDHWTCQECGCNWEIQVHHKKYPKRLGSERLSDLVTLCRDCHEEAHAPKRRPKPKDS